MKNRLDWQSLLLAIRHKGLTGDYIGSYCGVSRHVIDRFIRGVNHSEPSFTVGLKMLRLHRRECPDRHEREIYANV